MSFPRVISATLEYPSVATIPSGLKSLNWGTRYMASSFVALRRFQSSCKSKMIGVSSVGLHALWIPSDRRFTHYGRLVASGMANRQRNTALGLQRILRAPPRLPGIARLPACAATRKNHLPLVQSARDIIDRVFRIVGERTTQTNSLRYRAGRELDRAAVYPLELPFVNVCGFWQEDEFEAPSKKK